MHPAIAEAGLTTSVIHEDLRAHFESFFDSKPVCEGGAEACVGGKDLKTGKDAFYEQYQNTAAIFAKMDLIGESDLVELFTFGESYEGMPLRGFKITGQGGFDSGTNAREWIPVTFCVSVIDMLAQEYGNDPTVT